MVTWQVTWNTLLILLLRLWQCPSSSEWLDKEYTGTQSYQLGHISKILGVCDIRVSIHTTQLWSFIKLGLQQQKRHEQQQNQNRLGSSKEHQQHQKHNTNSTPKKNEWWLCYVRGHCASWPLQSARLQFSFSSCASPGGEVCWGRRDTTRSDSDRGESAMQRKNWPCEDAAPMSVRCSHPWHRAPLLVEGAPCAITGGKSTLAYTFSKWQSTSSARRDTSVTTRRRWFAVWGWQTEMTCWHAPSGYPHNTSSNLCPLLQQYIGAPILCKHAHPPRLRRDVSDSLRSSFHDPSTSDIGGDIQTDYITVWS